jgi:hypothetical protein
VRLPTRVGSDQHFHYIERQVREFIAAQAECLRLEGRCLFSETTMVYFQSLPKDKVERIYPHPADAEWYLKYL